MKKRVVIWGTILCLVALKTSVYGMEDNNITTENMNAIENKDITTENVDAIDNKVKEKENDIKKQEKKLGTVTSGIKKIKEDGIYKIATSQDISKAIEIPGENKENNIQVGIWDYR